ncbi:fungal-specific transcription factor domain-containing protein, partial [Auriculariales sp. MPI-PUGE-AT-0066]
MPSSDATTELTSASSLKHGTPRACDACRRRKSRCDGPEQADRICTRCAASSIRCMYTNDVKRPATVSKRYVELLEERVAKAEHLLRRHSVEGNLMRRIGSLAMGSSANFATSSSAEGEIPDPDHTLLGIWHADDWAERFLVLKDIATGDDTGPGATSEPFRWSRMRSAFWSVPACEFRAENHAYRRFIPQLPPPNELAALVHVYFNRFNIYHPVLHRLLFEQQLLDEVVMCDFRFLAVVLLVCAIGARHLPKSEQQGQDPSTPIGWHYFEQVEPLLRPPISATPLLLDQQLFFLASIYLMTLPHQISATWVVFGMSVQIAFHAGTNRRKVLSEGPTLIDELWKRSFWAMVLTDRTAAAIRGQPPIIPDEAFDVELPLEVDDRVWDLTNPSQGYPLVVSLPPDVPSPYGFFNWRVRLTLILGTTLRTLYSFNRSRLLMGFTGVDWESQTLNRLGNLLREWQESLPSYRKALYWINLSVLMTLVVRWNPHETNLELYIMSASLCTTFYALQITTFNPFIRGAAPRDFVVSRTSKAPTRPGDANGTAVFDASTSLAMCTKAAMSCSQILSILVERCPEQLTFPAWIQPAFSSGLVLLVNMFGFRSNLSSLHVALIGRLLRACMDTILIISRSWDAANSFRDTLDEISTGLEHDLPPSTIDLQTPGQSPSRHIP